MRRSGQGVGEQDDNREEAEINPDRISSTNIECFAHTHAKADDDSYAPGRTDAS